MTTGVKRSGLALIAPALVGLASGLVGAALMTVWHERPAPEAPRAAEPGQPATIITPAHAAGDAQRQVRELQIRQRALELELERQRPSGEKPEEAPPASALDKTRQHQQALTYHQQDRRDPQWATHAEGVLRADIKSLPHVNAEATRVDCRTSTCSLELEWPSYGSALENFGRVLTHSYGVSCGTQILLPEPTHRDTPYRATALLNCESDRSGSHG